MTASPPTLDVCDAELARLSAANDAIGSTLFELDGDATRKLLTIGPLRGVTGQRWQVAQTHIAELWTGHQLLGDAVAAAAALRTTARRLGRDELDRLATALFADSIELSSASVPLTQRALLGPRQQSTRCTPGQLLSAMETAFDDVRGVLADVAAAWQWQLPRLAGGESERAALRAKSAEPAAQLGQVDAAFSALSAAVASDPLATGPDDFAEAEAALARARATITSAEELRIKLADILAGGAGLLADIAALHAEAVALHREASIKIAGHPGPPPVEPDPTLTGELSQLTAVTEGAGASAGGRVLAWEQRARSAYDAARAEVEANRAPLSERAELRGRLEAYTAKAARHGLAETVQLSRMAERARDGLYTAPCDLPAARRALAAYVNAVTAATSTAPATSVTPVTEVSR